MEYLLLIFVLCIVALNKRDLVLVWEDNFDWNGAVDHNKWDFDEGDSGWSLSFISLNSLHLVFKFRQ
jgi:hypothetical protein